VAPSCTWPRFCVLRLDPKEAHVAAEQHFCERHHGTAVASPVRIPPDGARETEHVCASDLAEQGVAASRREAAQPEVVGS
jgi:hypothetical protein